MDNYNYEFHEFDVKDGRLPEPYDLHYSDIVYKARSYLQDFSKAEIERIGLGLTNLLRNPEFIDPLYSDIERAEIVPVVINGVEHERVITTSDIDAIYQQRSKFRLEHFIELENLKWHHVFAVMALHLPELVAQLISHQQTYIPNSTFTNITNQFIKDLADNYLPNATKALTIAEHLKSLPDQYKKIQSEQNSKAVTKRFDKNYGPLKEAVIKLYEEKFAARSNRDAADKILSELIESGTVNHEVLNNRVYFNGVLTLQTDSPQHQFEKWIGAHKRANSKSS